MRLAITFAVVLVSSTAAAGPLIGAELDVIPASSLEIQAQGPMSLSAATTIGLSSAFGYRARYVSIALAPRYVPSEHLQLDPNSTWGQVDLGVRLGGHYDVAPEVELFGFVAPGYSVIYDNGGNSSGNRDGAAGVAVNLGAGAAYTLSRHVQVTAQLAYEYGDQHTNDGALTATRQLSLAVGVVTR